MITNGRAQILPLALILVTATVVGCVMHARANPEQEAILSDPFYDRQRDAWTVSLRMKRGGARVPAAEVWFERALDRLAEAEFTGKRRIVKVHPGHYVFGRPVTFKARHLGIALRGEPARIRALTRRKVAADRYRQEIDTIAPRVPILDGAGVASFIVVDGVAAERHVTTTVAGFYLVQQMSGLGGVHYPDFSYRLTDSDFHSKGGYYTRYAFNDGGVVSVLGNASITLADNIIDQPLAYQCGGVLRNEQYGGDGTMPASRVVGNLVINPFAWHTGAFVDNTTGSFVEVRSNQVLIDRDMPHEVALITNFEGAYLVAENNRLVDVRVRRRVATVGIGILGRERDFSEHGNSFEGIDRPQDHIARGTPRFRPDRGVYFLFQRAKAFKLMWALFNERQFVMPGGWPDEMNPYVRAEG